MTPSETKVPQPAEIRQALMEGGREVIGPQAAEHLFARLNGAPGGGLAELNRLLQDDYGRRGGQGLALRLGRAFFRHGLRIWIADSTPRASEFRLLPAPRRIRTALASLAGFFNRNFDCIAAMADEESAWLWRVTECPACLGQTSDGTDCYLLAGVLQETLAWAGGGRIYRVREVECSAAGAPACLFQVDKHPLD